MKKLYSLFALLLVGFVSQAQETKVTIVGEDANSIVLHYQFGKYDLLETEINGLSAFRPQMEDATPIMEASTPDLLKISKNIDFSELCITSHAMVQSSNTEDVTAETTKAQGNKCPVCWKISKEKCARHSN